MSMNKETKREATKSTVNVKSNIMPVAVLGIICLFVAALLAVVNMVAAPKIADRENQKSNAALLVVLPGAVGFEEIELTDSYPSEITKAYKANLGYVFETKVQGKESMTVMCGVDNDGKLVKLEVISEAETPDYKKLVFPLVTGDNGKYNGVSSDNLEPELVSGATLTSKGIYSAVKTSLDAYIVANGGTVEKEEEPADPKAQYAKSEDEIKALAMELVDGATGFSAVTLDGDYENLIAVYKEDGGNGYVAYVMVISSHYGTVESEALIHIQNNGKIKNINKLVWKTSDAGWGFVPPADDVVDAFYDRLPNNDSDSIGDVELITGATSTSTGVVNSFKEALSAVDKLIAKDMPTPESDVLELAKSFVGEGADIENVTPEGTEYVRRVYRDKVSGDYFAYVVVISSHYGTVETESLIHIKGGRVEPIEKMTWKTSDAGWGFVPPAQDIVDAFYDRLLGSDASSIGGVELITGATSTSSGVMNSFKEALATVNKIIAEDMPTPEEDIIARIMAFVGSDAVLENVTPSGVEHVRRIYRNKTSGGYIAYVTTPGQYVPIANEALVYIDGNGDIIKVDHFGWIVGNNISNEGFADRFDGKDLWSVGDVELITQATYTSSDLRAAVENALLAVAKMTVRTEDKLLELADKIVPNSKGFEPVDIADGAPDALRRLYRETSGRGYVAYIVTTGWGGSIATESIVYFNTERTVVDVDILIWNVGHGVGYGDFDKNLIGANPDTIEEVELITECTGTSGDLRAAIAEVMSYVPSEFPIARVVGIAMIVLAAVISISITVVIKCKRRKNG